MKKLFAILVVFFLAAMLIGPRYFLPAEDAIILHQYSRNLAETGAITFNSHGPRAEGATDFLWMVILAAGFKLGLNPLYFTEVLNVVCLIVLALLLVKIGGSRPSVERVLLVVGSLLLAPQLIAAVEGFSVIAFGVALVAVVFFLHRKDPAPAMVSALLLCLLRPDGIVFALPLLLTFLPMQKSRRFYLQSALLLFVLPGLAYFFWRWHYFGHLFPLPFLVKSDVHRRFGVLAPGSMAHALRYLVFALLILMLGCRNAWKDAAQRAVLFSLLVVPTLFYLAMRLDQNVADRFFFYIPLTVLLLVAINWRHLTAGRRTLLITSMGLYVVLLGRTEYGFAKEFVESVPVYKRQAQLAKQLDSPELRGTLLSSEAGLLPYFSRWAAVDPWGLNTAEFATHLIQPSEVAALRPDLVVLHGDTDNNPCNVPLGPPNSIRTWGNMITNVQNGVGRTQYDAWLLPDTTNVEMREADLGKASIPSKCWFVLRTYRGRSALSELLSSHGGVLQDSFVDKPRYNEP